MAAHLVSTAIAFSQESGEESNFYSLRDQADSQLQDLVTLSSERRATLLGALQELLRDQQALQELEDTVMDLLARLGKDSRSRQTGTGQSGQEQSMVACSQLTWLH